MEVVILAAGYGHRMANFADHKPKALISINGIPLIDHLLKNLLYLDITRLISVVGYQKDQIITHLKENYSQDIELTFAVNNNISRENAYSLFCARRFVDQDHFLLIMADHYVDTEIYKNVWDVAEQGDVILATDTLNNLNDVKEATKVLLKGNRILKIGKNLKFYSAYDTGIFAMSKKIFPILEELNKNQYKIGISDLINCCIKKNLPVISCDVSSFFWMDLDTKQDIELLLQQIPIDEKNTGHNEIL